MKNAIQQLWESLAYEAKWFFKSHDLTNFLQFLLLLIPIIIWAITLKYNVNEYIVLSGYLISLFALIYYIYYWKDTQLYKKYWEEYITLYNDVRNTYKMKSEIEQKEIDNFYKKRDKINNECKPSLHPFAKYIVDKTIEKEMKYWNESIVWWKE